MKKTIVLLFTFVFYDQSRVADSTVLIAMLSENSFVFKFNALLNFYNKPSF